jgi:hypothetical protein
MGRWAPAAVLLAFGSPLLLAACTSSASTKSSAQHSVSPIAASCEQVSATLSDGPDRTADPVGYALAQIRPLREIHVTSGPLRRAINDLAAAYQSFYSDNGAKSAVVAVAASSEVLDRICPGATS